jgi:Ca2+-binding RTX toxin-like protein
MPIRRLTNGDDRYTGTAGRDVIHGLDGYDEMYGLRGNDVLAGDAGADRIYGGQGADTLYGGDGNDSLQGNTHRAWNKSDFAQDRLFGGAGDDELCGADPGRDILRGDEGNDLLWINNDLADGGSGNDELWVDLEGAAPRCAVSDVTMGSGVDLLNVSLYQASGHRIVVRDFAAGETVRLSLPDGLGDRLDPRAIFNAMDISGDNTLDAADAGGGGEVGGFQLAVRSADGGLTLDLDGNLLELRGVTALADWQVV